jgi:hypothetical protein
MHRSGTSAVARGLKSLGVHLGENYLDTRPDNPTGYWEDRTIVEFNDRVLGVLGLSWEDARLIPSDRWSDHRFAALREDLLRYLRANFSVHLWGFKDPRTMRLLPVWRPILEELNVKHSYLVVIRNPLSMVESLKRRQAMPAADAHRLWLAYVVPGLMGIHRYEAVVTDYDLLMEEPRAELVRIAQRLHIPLSERLSDIDQFADAFLQPRLRHSYFDESEFDLIPKISPLSREAYLRLRRVAADQAGLDSSEFLSAWERLSKATENLLCDAGTRGQSKR